MGRKKAFVVIEEEEEEEEIEEPLLRRLDTVLPRLLLFFLFLITCATLLPSSLSSSLFSFSISPVEMEGVVTGEGEHLTVVTVLHCLPSPHFPSLFGLINSTIFASFPYYRNISFRIGIPTTSITSDLFSLLTTGEISSSSSFSSSWVCGSQGTEEGREGGRKLLIRELIELLQVLFPQCHFEAFGIPSSVLPKEFNFLSFYLYGTQLMAPLIEQQPRKSCGTILYLPLHSFFSSSLPPIFPKTSYQSNRGLLSSLDCISYYAPLRTSDSISSFSATPPESWFPFFSLDFLLLTIEELGGEELRELFFPRISKRIYIFATGTTDRLTANTLFQLRKLNLEKYTCIITFEWELVTKLKAHFSQNSFSSSLCAEYHPPPTSQWKSGFLRINTQEYGKMILWRSHIIDRKARLGESFTHNDVDSIWRKETLFQEMENNSWCDVRWMVDTHLPVTNDALINGNHRPALWLNGGFYQVFNNARTRKFFHSIFRLHKGTTTLLREQPNIVKAIETLPNGYQVFVEPFPPTELIERLKVPRERLVDSQDSTSPLRICALPTGKYRNGNLYFISRDSILRNTSVKSEKDKEERQEALDRFNQETEKDLAVLHYNNVRMSTKEFCMAVNSEDWSLDDVSTKAVLLPRYLTDLKFRQCFLLKDWEFFERRDLTSLLPGKITRRQT